MSQSERIDVGSVIADTVRVYFASLPRLAPVAVLAHVPVMLIDTIDTLTHDPNDTSLGLTRVSMALGTLAAAVIAAYAVPPVMSALGHRGAPSFGSVSGRIGAAIGTAWTTNLIVGLGLLCLLVPGIVLSLYYCVAVPAAVAEGMGAGRALERSKTLTEGHRTTALVLNLVYGLVLIGTVLVTIAPSVVIEMDAEATGQTLATPLIVALTVVPTAIQSLVVVLGATLSTVFYVRLRERKDGLDAEALADVFS